MTTYFSARKCFVFDAGAAQLSENDVEIVVADVALCCKSLEETHLSLNGCDANVKLVAAASSIPPRNVPTIIACQRDEKRTSI